MGVNTFPSSHLFANHIPTSTPENIYYADLFEINGRTWMIQGFGKTEAARIATNKNDKCMIGLDSVAIVQNGNTLEARLDQGGAASYSSGPCALHKLDVIAYCLSPEQTEKAYKPRDGKLEIVEVDNKVLASLCSTYPYPGALVPNFFTSSEVEYFHNKWRMTQRFLELTTGTVGTRFLLVPYMPLVQDKAELYRGFV